MTSPDRAPVPSSGPSPAAAPGRERARAADGDRGTAARATGSQPRLAGARPVVDTPRTPISPGGWDAHSRALLGPGPETPPAGCPPTASEPSSVGCPPTAREPSPIRPPATGPDTCPAAAEAEHPPKPADPVLALMRQYQALCAHAVDPLEIAAGLEARGITDRTAAARFRHRDVFSLAEELYARTPRADELYARTRRADELYAPEGSPPGAPRARRPAGGTPGVRVATALGTGWLLGFAFLGDPLLTELLSGDPDPGWSPAWPPRVPPVAPGAVPSAVALALAVLPAAYCTRWFALRSRRSLWRSQGLREFTRSVRPLLAAAVALFLCALTLLVLGARLVPPARDHRAAPAAAAVALGGLLFLARLLAGHGRARVALTGIAAACALEAATLGAAAAARLPGCASLDRPVQEAVAAGGPAVVPAVGCAVAALALLCHALGTLARASAHRPAAAPAGAPPCSGGAIASSGEPR